MIIKGNNESKVRPKRSNAYKKTREILTQMPKE